MLSKDAFRGPWAGLPVAWSDRDEFDEATYRRDVAACCQAGIPGVYSGGTTGEFYAMEFDEFKAVNRAMVDEAKKHHTPTMVGCTATYTLGVIRRARYAMEIGADAIQIALPYWMPVDEDQLLPFFRDVAKAVPDMAISIYETERAKRILTLEQHRVIHKEIPAIKMVKANSGTLGYSIEGCRALSQFTNVFVAESRWNTLGPCGAAGCCSAMVYYNPEIILELWQAVERGDWAHVERDCAKLEQLVSQFYLGQLGYRGYTDTAFDRLGGRASGFLHTSLRSRTPYAQVVPEDVDRLRAWYRDHFPQMLELRRARRSCPAD